ncbi:HD domain-containing protein [Paenibacillus marinisediminis]
MNTEAEIIRLAEQYVKRELERDSSGHDWWHIDRVRKLAVEIANREGANNYICELAALLHDVADEKLNESKEAGLHKVENWLLNHIEDRQLIDHIMLIISTMSYRGGTNPPMTTLEGRVVQDADRLDAIGAIGIARTFQYSGWKGRSMHNPELYDSDNDTVSNERDTTIQHFYDKLLKLKDLMNTSYAKQLAQSRHQFMEQYLQQFYDEWDAVK